VCKRKQLSTRYARTAAKCELISNIIQSKIFIIHSSSPAFHRIVIMFEIIKLIGKYNLSKIIQLLKKFYWSELITLFAAPISYVRVEVGVNMILTQAAAAMKSSNSDLFCGGFFNLISGSTVNGLVTSKTIFSHFVIANYE